MSILLPRLRNDSCPELSLNELQLDARSEVERKIDTGIYQFEHTNCAICGADQGELVGQKDRYGLFYATKICSSCGLVYTDPRMNEASYRQFYNEEYRKLYVATEKPTEDFFRKQEYKGWRIFQFLSSNMIVTGTDISVLEVGCGAGGILHFFKNKGARVMGIDLGSEYVNYGRQVYGLDLRVGSLIDVELSFKPDLIIYSHVLEHLLDLDSELSLVRKLSKSDTVLYVEVPGIKEIHKHYEMNILRYFQNAHTYHFTLETLNNLMAKNGFELICGNQFVRSAFKLRKGKQCIPITSDYLRTREYLLATERRRKYFALSKAAIKKELLKLMLKFLDILNLRVLAQKKIM
jgi:2-polyprenyl-3-methyl-5-hydroxy-6-metoxy-1,4-benzoquinol methylase